MGLLLRAVFGSSHTIIYVLFSCTFSHIFRMFVKEIVRIDLFVSKMQASTRASPWSSLTVEAFAMRAVSRRTVLLHLQQQWVSASSLLQGSCRSCSHWRSSVQTWDCFSWNIETFNGFNGRFAWHWGSEEEQRGYLHLQKGLRAPAANWWMILKMIKHEARRRRRGRSRTRARKEKIWKILYVLYIYIKKKQPEAEALWLWELRWDAWWHNSITMVLCGLQALCQLTFCCAVHEVCSLLESRSQIRCILELASLADRIQHDTHTHTNTMVRTACRASNWIFHIDSNYHVIARDMSGGFLS